MVVDHCFEAKQPEFDCRFIHFLSIFTLFSLLNFFDWSGANQIIQAGPAYMLQKSAIYLVFGIDIVVAFK